VTDPITYLPKLFTRHTPEFRTILKWAAEEYNQREEHYKRLASAELHVFLLRLAHDNLIQNKKSDIIPIKKSEVVAENILRYLNTHYMQRISSVDIEDRFEVNFDYINKVFSSLTGTTIFHYLNAVRINHAKELIETTSMTFGEIGCSIGIEDRYYFTKQFKKYCGMTSTEYFKCMNRSYINKEADTG